VNFLNRRKGTSADREKGENGQPRRARGVSKIMSRPCGRHGEGTESRPIHKKTRTDNDDGRGDRE